MPARTNEFQRLIAVLHSALGPDWNVTESKLLIDRAIQELREVDVVIEGRAGPHSVTLCIECRDRSRAADVTWIEEMHTKHEHLPTNKLVLVSASGFSQAAKKKAAVLGMDLLELAQAEAVDWAGIATKFAEVFLQVVRFQLSVSVEVDRADGQRGYEDVPRDTPILVADSGSLPIGTIADHISQMAPVAKVALEYVKPGEEKDFWARFEPPVAMRSIDSMGVKRAVHSIAVGFHATGSMATVKLRSGVIGDAAVAFGVADFGTERLHVSVVERQGSPPSISAGPWTPRAT